MNGISRRSSITSSVGSLRDSSETYQPKVKFKNHFLSAMKTISKSMLSLIAGTAGGTILVGIVSAVLPGIVAIGGTVFGISVAITAPWVIPVVAVIGVTVGATGFVFGAIGMWKACTSKKQPEFKTIDVSASSGKDLKSWVYSVQNHPSDTSADEQNDGVIGDYTDSHPMPHPMPLYSQVKKGRDNRGLQQPQADKYLGDDVDVYSTVSGAEQDYESLSRYPVHSVVRREIDSRVSYDNTDFTS